MPGGPLHGRGCGATGPRHAGQALIHAMRKMACAESSCGHDGQKVQQFWKLFQFMGHLNRTSVSAVIRFNTCITERFLENHGL